MSQPGRGGPKHEPPKDDRPSFVRGAPDLDEVQKTAPLPPGAKPPRPDIVQHRNREGRVVGIERRPRRRVPPEVEAQLRAVPIPDVLHAAGVVTKERKEGGDTRYWTSDGSQVVVSRRDPSAYNDVTPAHRYHGRGAIDLAMQLTGGNYLQAVEWLQARFGAGLRHETKPTPPPSPPPPAPSFSSGPASFELPPKHPDSARLVVDYLVSRGIDPVTAKSAFDAELVYATESHGHVNLVWPMKGLGNYANVSVAALVRGFEGPPDSSAAYRGKLGSGGVWLACSGDESKVNRVVWFENPIDALSYISLQGADEGTMYAAVGGLNGLEKRIPGALPGVRQVLAIDNDRPADEAWEKLHAQFPHLERELPRLKDWNADLRSGLKIDRTVDSWLEGLSSSSSRESYEKELDLFARDFVKADRTAALDALLSGKVTVEGYEAFCRERGLARSSVRKKTAIIKSLEVAAGQRTAWNPLKPPAAGRSLLEKKTGPVFSSQPDSQAVVAAEVPSSPSRRSLRESPPLELGEPELKARSLLVEWLGRAEFSATTKDTYLREVALFGRWVSMREGRGDEGSPESGLAALLADKSLAAEYGRHLESQGLAPKTRQKKLSALSSILSVENGIRGQVALPPGPRSSPRSGPTAAAIAAVMERVGRKSTPDAKRTLALLQLGAVEGLRLEEARSLRIEDVDLDGCRLNVLGKGMHGKRVWLPMFDPRTRDVLVTWLAVRYEAPGVNAVFTALRRELAGPVVRQMSRKGIQDCIARLHLPRHEGPGDASYHGLRHSAVTMWLDSGMSETDVAARARWTVKRMISIYDDTNRVG